MPSYLKYRIKRPSIDETPLIDGYSAEYKTRLTEMGVISDTDKNIKKYTCTNLIKVYDESQTYYLCLIKYIEMNPALSPSTGQGINEAEDVSIVNGASDLSSLSLSDSAQYRHWYNTAFVCNYANPRTGEAVKISSPNPDVEDTICFAQCNCYQPRGGLVVSFLDGAVKNYGRFAYLQNLTSETQEKYIADDWKRFQEGGRLPDYFTGGLPKSPITFNSLISNTPSGISHLFMSLNARATVAPCCYWDRSEIIVYEPYFFRVVDLAIAKANLVGSKWGGYTPYANYKPEEKSEAGFTSNEKKRWTIRPISEYIYQLGDYFDPNSEEGNLKNRLLGRNYDVSLPSTGNNQRIIYALRPEYVGALVKNDNNHADCIKYGGYHFHSFKYFNPQNCAHPDLEVRYRWGCLCNGGGCFDLDEGRACPEYYNPLMGDRTSKRHSKLEKMYPGDTITAASILELMWLSKGGVEWTKEEWEYVWKQPYLWTTIPDYMTNTPNVEELPDDEDKLSLSKKKKALIPRILSQKTIIDITTGEITSGPVTILPAGSMTLNKYNSSGSQDTDVVPNFPSTIKKIEFKPISSINIQWPRASFTTVTSSERISDTKTFVSRKQAEEKEKKEPYCKLFFGPSGQSTSVIGSITSGYSDTVYCFNASFLTDQTIKSQFLSILEKGTYLTKDGQSFIYKMWLRLFSNRLITNKPLLDGMPLAQTTVSDRQFIFRKIPLSTLDIYNYIIVCAINKSSRIDFGYVKVKPIFRHGYMFQEDTTFMGDWNSWEGYPETFFDISTDTDLAFLGKPYGKLSVGGGAIEAFDNTAGLEIPSNAGYTTWKSVVIGPPTEKSIIYHDLVPYSVDQPNFAYKARFYDSRSDSRVGTYGKQLETIGSSKWYTLASCSPYVIIIMDPEICNAYKEFMVYYLNAIVTTKTGDQKILNFVPMVYSQLARSYPSEQSVFGGENFDPFSYQATEKSSKVLKDTFGNYEVLNPGPNFDLPETDTHPWVIIARAVDASRHPKGVPIWRYIYDPPWNSPEEYPSTDVVFDKTNTVLYMHYASLTDIEYKWNHTKKYYNLETETARSRYSNRADGNLYRTIYKYNTEGEEKIDGFTSVIHGSKSMTAIWPWVTVGCRDVEILYAWGNNVRAVKVRPAQSNCYGSGPSGYIEVDVGRGGGSSSENVIEAGYRINLPLCGDHDIRRGGGTSYGPLYYPYNECTFASYNILNDCMFDFSLMLPSDAMDLYAIGQLPNDFERLRGPTYYTLSCAKIPQIYPVPCQGQFRYINTVRDSGQNTFAGWSMSKGPAYLEEDLSNYIEDGRIAVLPKFGNMGRQIWQLNLAYLSKKLYYDDESRKVETSVLDVPKPECTRSLMTVSSSGINPYYYYLFSNDNLGEVLEESVEPTSTVVRLLSNSSMVGYGHVSKDVSGLSVNHPIYWAWPRREVDYIDRGQRVIRELPKALQYTDHKDNYTDNAKMLAVNTIECPPYKMMSNGIDISLGPEIDTRDGVETGETEAYYVIITESEKYENGIYTPPYIWSQRVNKSLKTINNLIADPALKYTVSGGHLVKLTNPVVSYPNFITSKTQRELTESAGEFCNTVSGLNYAIAGTRTNPDPNNLKKFEVKFTMPNVQITDKKLESIHVGLKPLLGTWIDSISEVTLDLTTQAYNDQGTVVSYYNSIVLSNGSADYNNRISVGIQEKYSKYDFIFTFKSNTPKITDDPTLEFKDGSGQGNLIYGDTFWSPPTVSRNAGYVTLGPYTSMWNGNLSALISGMSFMVYKSTNIYPGLNLYDIDPVLLGKAEAEVSLDSSSPYLGVRWSLFTPNDALSELRTQVQIKGFEQGLNYFEIEYKDDLKSKKDISIVVTASGYSTKDGTLYVCNSRVETPLDNTAVPYFTNFPIIKDLVIDFSCLIIQSRHEFSGDPFWQTVVTGTLSDFVSKIRLHTLIAGKQAELIKIEQANFKVTIGEQSTKPSKYIYYEDLIASDFSNPQQYKLPITPDMVNQLTARQGKGGIVVNSLGASQNDPRKPVGVAPIQMPGIPFNRGSLKLKGRLWVYEDVYKNAFLVTTGAFEDEWYRSPSKRSASELFEMEKFQQDAYQRGLNLNPLTDNTLDATAIIPYSDWLTLGQITGEAFANTYPNMSFDREALSELDLVDIQYDIKFKWFTWDWNAVSKYTFDNAEGNRYGPANGGVESWSAPGHAVDLDRSDEAFELVSAAIPRTYIAYRQGIWIIRFFSAKQSVLAWDAPWAPPWAYEQGDTDLEVLLSNKDCAPGQIETCSNDPRTLSLLNVNYQQHIYDDTRYSGDQNEQAYMVWLRQKSLRTQQLAMVGMPGGTGWSWVGLYTNTMVWENNDYNWPGVNLR